jgi:sigma-B regulation protein RsbU (phosphoserine phosphatase)
MNDFKVFCADTFSVALLDEMPDMIRVFGPDGRVLFANRAMQARFGPQEGSCDRMPGVSRKCPECIVRRCIASKRRYSTIMRGRSRVYTVSACPVPYEGSIYALEVFTDITKEQNLKDKLMISNSRMMKDLEVARSLQLSILRHMLPDIPGYHFAAEFLPCEALGGDMYDCFLTRDGRVFMYVADVSGHGVMPAMLTVYLRQELFAQCKAPGISPVQVLHNLQNSFEELNTEESIYITVFLLALDPGSGEFVCANAGHSVPPLIAGRNGIREVLLPGTPICRWVDSVDHEQMTGVLEKGEKLLLYTDGLDGIHTGRASTDDLSAILMCDLHGRQLLDEIKKKFTQTRADDVTMVLCEREG